MEITPCKKSKIMKKINIKVGWERHNYSACTDDYDNLGGLVIATGKTIEILKKEFESALKFHIEGCLADGDSLPEWLVAGNYELNFALEASALLRYAEKYTSLVAISRASGINERQLGHYASGYRKPRIKQQQRIIEGIHKIGKELSTVQF